MGEAFVLSCGEWNRPAEGISGTLGKSAVRIRKGTHMAEITHHGQKIQTSGSLPALGAQLPDFRLVDQDLGEHRLADFKGKKLVLNIFPSVDTGVCATSVRRFNRDASGLENSAVLCISEDLPFAHKRFCGAEGIQDVISLSTVRGRSFGKDYGLRIEEGALTGLLSRSVIVTDSSGKVVYTEQVPEIGQEPNYEKALEAVKKAN